MANRYKVSKRQKIAIEQFFAKVSTLHRNNEMLTTYLGRDPKDGGMVTIPWNLLVNIFWDYINEARGNKKGVLYVAKEK